MPLRSSVPRTTHQWLKPLYNYLDNGVKVTVPSGASGIANGAWLGSNVLDTQIANATGAVGFYGSTGILRPTGLSSTAGATGVTFFDQRSNGGTGANFYTLADLVAILKSRGDIAV